MKKDYKHYWMRNHFKTKILNSTSGERVWIANDTTLYDFIWRRDIVPWDIISRKKIDFKAIKNAKQKYIKDHNIKNTDDIRILKNVYVKGQQFDMVIDVRDPRYDWYGNSYEFIIRFTKKVNNLPFIYENLCIRAVFECKEGTDNISDKNVKTIMLNEPNKGEFRGGLLINKIVNAFNSNSIIDNINPNCKIIIDEYRSKALRDTLFNYLVFIKIRGIKEVDRKYNVLDDNNYSIYRIDGNNILSCAITKSEAQKIADGICKCEKNWDEYTLEVVYLIDDTNTNDNFSKRTNVISIEDYCNKKQQNCYKKQIEILRSMPNVDYEDDCNIDLNKIDQKGERWSYLFIPKKEEVFRRVIDKQIKGINQKYISRKKRTYTFADNANVYTDIKNRNNLGDEEIIIRWKNDVYFTTNEDDTITIRDIQPTNDKGWRLCYLDKEEIEKKDKITISNAKSNIIVPEKENKGCYISEQMRNKAIDYINNSFSINKLDNTEKCFAILCAVNLVNAYKKYNKHSEDVPDFNNRLYTLLDNSEIKDVKVDTLKNKVTITIKEKVFHFTFPIQDKKEIEDELQPIAPLLYEYSQWLINYEPNNKE